MQPPHCPGRLSTAPDVGLPGSASTARTKASPPRTPPPEKPRAAARGGSRRPQPWVPGKTLVRRRGGASAARLCSPAEHAGTGAAMATGAPRPAPPLSASRAGLPAGACLIQRRGGGPGVTKMVGDAGGSGGEGRKLRSPPSHRCLSRSGSGEEMARRLRSSCLRVWPDGYLTYAGLPSLDAEFASPPRWLRTPSARRPCLPGSAPSPTQCASTLREVRAFCFPGLGA